MAAAQYNLSIDQGATFKITDVLTDANAAPIDLTGYTFDGQIRTFPGATTVLATFTIALTPDVDNNNSIDISLTDVDTAAIPAPTTLTGGYETSAYWYDIDIVSPEGTVTRILQGQAIINPSVTR